ncbi:methionyl-tRNA formyltransferase [Nitrospirillum viridazoti]|uniref:Methionyl-tRNA formyltransferase n=1 Tax=Nitrospirillum viridazoti CBAmc TaxID=1441467 RepID=A0A248JLW6_9PROT|nr:methionyl-tRNA formyltransferase [Nitrospirillum amazonense]ASG19705.1 methionyl-tRNA formyltransferase [Nitrospirillum amazonense CBAmc]TWB27242.1 methionyl-tRNA formyltransferase [Nitrospirillum amazonense]
MTRLRLAFMGTPDFSVPVLDALVAAGHEVACVYSQPPRPAGRGHKEQLTPVHARAAALGIPVRTPRTLRKEEAQAEFRDLNLDVAVVVAYGLILPQAILDAPRLGCLNIHASLLPRWRGAAPIQRAILAGDAESGVTIMQMEAGLDTGPMLLEERIALTPRMTASQLHDGLSAMGARLIVTALDRLAAGDLPATVQPEEGVTYAAKLTKEEGLLDFTKPAAELDRQVRALTPWPGTWFEAALEGGTVEKIKVLAAEPVAGTGAPGTLLDANLTVACGEGALRLTTVQRPGKGPVEGAAFLRGFPHQLGQRIAQ